MIEKQIDLTGLKLQEPEPIHNFGGISPDGLSLAVNSKYFLRNGEPWFPIMGEFHFSRYPESEWEEELLKMKSGGIEIVATYVFWIHHEEIKGEFDWSGRRNLREFVKLCGKHGLYMWLRIGPWAHGECRNGGFPDWVENGGFETRCDSEPYLGYVKRFFQEISLQVQGMLFQDNGPVIGIQLENEYGHCGGFQGEKGRRHMLTLKKLCMEAGLVVPFYTATAWGGAVVVEGETLPVYGGYVEAPWDRHIQEQRASREYLFQQPGRETNIGTDLQTGSSGEHSFSIDRYPFLTAELGGGIQVTQHRRPYLTGDDIEAFVLSRLGSGIALLGYYMYHGGTNPKGKLTTLQETIATGMWNDLPEYSYDFQAPLREYGQMKDSYGKLRRIHSFVRDFGRELAVSETILPGDLPKDAEDMESLRYSVRYGSKGGFLFLNNFQRRREMTGKKNICISIRTANGLIQFPGFDMKNGSRWIFPFDLSLGKVHLQWATAQLLCRLHSKREETVVFFGDEEAALNISSEGIQSVEVNGAVIHTADKCYEIKIPVPGREVYVRLKLKDGSSMTLLVLSKTEAEQALKYSEEGQDYLFLSDADLYCSGKELRIGSKTAAAYLSVYPAGVSVADAGTSSAGASANCMESKGCRGLFADYRVLFRNEADDHAIQVIEPGKVMDIEENGGIAAEFALPVEYSQTGDFGSSSVKQFLQIDFQGDKARLYINDCQVADWFYIGGIWEVGLYRFPKGRIRLEIDPLHKNDYVYLDKRPQFTDDICCRLNSLKAICYFQKALKIGSIG